MEKPASYKEEMYRYYRKELSSAELSEDVKIYRSYVEFVRKHPDYPGIKDATKEEYLLIKEKVRKETTEKWRKTMDSKSDEEKRIINKKKGSYYNNLSDEDKLKHNEVLRNRSNKFWNDMSDEERKSFSKYRESLIPEDIKLERNRRIKDNNKIRWENLSEEDKRLQCEKLQEGRHKANERISSDMKDWWANMNPLDKELYVKKVMKSIGSTNNGLNKLFESRIGNNINIIHEYPTTNNDVTHCWDYGIINDGKLNMVVDLDGAYFHADICDYDGVHSKLDYDEKRFKSIPDSVKHCIIRECNFDIDFDWFMKIVSLSYEDFINLETKYLVNMPTPYPEYSDQELLKSYDKLCKLTIDKYHHIGINTRLGDRIIHHFYYDVIWSDIKWNESFIKSALYNHTIGYPHTNKNKILQTVPHLEFISPGKYKMIIDECGYDKVYDETLNPSILLATMASGKTYVVDKPLDVRMSRMVDFFLGNGIKINISSDKQNAFLINKINEGQ